MERPDMETIAFLKASWLIWGNGMGELIRYFRLWFITICGYRKKMQE